MKQYWNSGKSNASNLIWIRKPIHIYENSGYISHPEAAVLGNFYLSSYACPYCNDTMYKTTFPKGKEYFINTATEYRVGLRSIFTCMNCQIFISPALETLSDGAIYGYEVHDEDEYVNFFKDISDKGSTEEENVTMNIQTNTVHAMIIDKKKMKLTDTNLPENYINTFSFLERNFKYFPIVKAKVGSSILTLICHSDNIYNQIIRGKEQKIIIRGCMIMEVQEKTSANRVHDAALDKVFDSLEKYVLSDEWGKEPESKKATSKTYPKSYEEIDDFHDEKISLWDDEEDMVEISFVAIVSHIAKNLKSIEGRRKEQWEYCFRWSIYAQSTVFNDYSTELVALETIGLWLAWYKQKSLFPVINKVHERYSDSNINEVKIFILKELYSIYMNVGTFTYTKYLVSEYGKIKKGEVLLNTIELENFYRILVKKIKYDNNYDFSKLPQTKIDAFLDMPI